MTPDVPFYLPWHVGWRTHLVSSVLTTDLAMGAVVWVVWHGLLAEPVVAAAPDRLRTRLSGVQLGLLHRLRSLHWALVAIVLGTLTHLGWDEFTHPDRQAVRRIGFLHDQWGPQHGYSWLQQISTVVGGMVMLAWTRRWWRRTAPAPVGHRESPPVVLALIAVVGLGTGTVAAVRSDTLRHAAFNAPTRGGCAALGAALLYAVAWHVRGMRR
jgi:hypothetical protein